MQKTEVRGQKAEEPCPIADLPASVMCSLTSDICPLTSLDSSEPTPT